MKKQFMATAALCALLGAAGCTTDSATGTFPALKFNNLEETAERQTTTVIIAGEFDDDDDLIAVNVTAFGQTFRLTEENSDGSRNTLVGEIDGTTVVINTPFENLFEALNNAQDLPAQVNFQSHVSGFIIRFETPDGVVVGDVVPANMGDPVMRPIGDNGLPLGEPETADIAAFALGDETDPANVGGFVTAPEGQNARATYRGSVRIIDAPSENALFGTRTLDGRITLEADFTDGTIGGRINDLTATPGVNVDQRGPGFREPTETDNLNPLPIRVGTRITDTILVNETDITGNTFSTDLDLLRQPESVGLGDDIPVGQIEEGFFSDSELNGTFFGENGEEVGGTLAYTREGDFEEESSHYYSGVAGDNIGDPIGPIPDDGPTAPAEGIGAFSAEVSPYGVQEN